MLNKLYQLSSDLNLDFITLPILSSEKFRFWSGSSKREQHHYGKGGLLQHTGEVVELCLLNAEYMKNRYPINEEELFLAALYHDYGKIWDYSPIDFEFKEWKSNDHKYKIHHISRSAMEFSDIARKLSYPADSRDRILHSILSHHQLREWGSPVLPATIEAWLLHQCDSISARLNDCGNKNEI